MLFMIYEGETSMSTCETRPHLLVYGMDRREQFAQDEPEVSLCVSSQELASPLARLWGRDGPSHLY